MNNQKDTQRTELNTYRQNNQSGVKALINRPINEFVNKKTEKLITALYMVTDCMEVDDALKGKLRLSGVELLSNIYRLSTLSTIDKHNHLSTSLSRISEILSFIEIAHTIGFISEMNSAILKKEFGLLISELQSYQSEDKHFAFTLDDKIFNVEKGDFIENPQKTQGQKIKDINKRTMNNSVSFRKNNNSNLSFTNKTAPGVSGAMNKNERYEKIMSIIRDKKDVAGNEEGISIKDISGEFSNCSEKTIQRELNQLILKGRIKKTGSKRWSRYGIVNND